jgi:hypothetical protein
LRNDHSDVSNSSVCLPAMESRGRADARAKSQGESKDEESPASASRTATGALHGAWRGLPVIRLARALNLFDRCCTWLLLLPGFNA